MRPAVDAARAAALIARLFHVRYTLRGVSYLLHRTGFSPQVPAHRAAERDEAKIAAWRATTWRRYEASGGDRSVDLLQDEAGQNLRPPKARTWARRGHTPVVKVSGKGSGRVSVAGLVCLRPGARGHLFYRVRIHRGRKGERRSMSEADYAGLIAAAHNQLHAPVILIWDNLNTHISAAMGRFVSSHPHGPPRSGCLPTPPTSTPPRAPGRNEKRLGNLSPAHDQLAASQEPAQAHPVPARAHRRVPRPDRTHPRVRTAVDIRPSPFKL